MNQPTWMQTVACLNALKSDADDEYVAYNLTKVLGEKRCVYSSACNSSELDFSTSPPSRPAFSEPGPSKSTPGPGGLHMWEPIGKRADFHQRKKDPSPLMKASGSVTSDVEIPPISQSAEITESSWILRTLSQVTFNSSRPDHETVGRRYLYAAPSEISGYVDEGYPPCAQIHSRQILEVRNMESL